MSIKLSERKERGINMVTLLDVIIEKMTIHELDLVKEKEKCAESVLPVNNLLPTVKDFFVEHISEARIGKSTKNCRFTANDTWLRGKVTEYQLAPTENNFLELSQGVSEKLFTTLKTSSSRSSGSFFVIEASIEKEKYIVLIKLDPKTRVQFNPTTLSLSIQENILPNSTEKIHKCALIRLDLSRDDTAHLYVLDKQQTQGEVSKFFMKNFLESEELINDSILTKEAMKKIKAELIKIVPEAKKYAILNEVDKEFTEGRLIDLESSLPRVLQKFDFEETFIEETSKTLITEFVSSNPDYQSSFTVVRTDTSFSFKSKNSEIFFRYNKSIRDSISMSKDAEGNTIIKIDKQYSINQK